MELPNYSCQLLQQLYMLCKERQFCDCTISIGTVYFRAHKLILAAASLLFKTLLDNTDTISIDASVVSPDEFALLLEMMYTGKLPVGKHNFSKIISLADSLQMFDVAVSCKNLLTSLVSCSGPSQVIRDASPQTVEPCKKDADRLLVENPSPKNVLVSSHSGEGPSPPVALKADTVVVVSAMTQEAGEVNPAAATQEEALEIEMKHAASPPETANIPQMHSLSPGKEVVGEEVEEEEVVEAACTSQKMTGNVTKPEHERKLSKLDFLLQNESIFSEALSVAQDVLKRLDECRDIKSPHKEAILECLEAKEGISAFKRILNKVRNNECLDVETVVSLLELFQDSHPEIRAALRKREPEDGENMQLKRSTKEGKTLSILLLEHKEDLIQSVTQLRPIREFLETAPGELLTCVEKEVILNCCEGGTPKETIENLLHRVTEEKTLTAESLVKLLQAVKITFPNLDLLLKDLQKQASVPSTAVQPSPDDFGTELLRRYHENLSEIFTDNEMLLKVISSASSLTSGEREAMEQLVKGDSGHGGFGALVSAVLEGQPLLGRAVWKVLLGAQTVEPGPLNLLMEMMHKEPGADYFFQAVATPESATIEIILRHGKLITEAIQPRAELKCLTPGEERLAEAVKEILSVSCEPASPEASLKAALSRAQEKSLPTMEMCRLLCSLHEVFPGLQAVLQELGSLGLLTKDKEPGAPERWKVLEVQGEASARSPAEPGEGSAKEKEAGLEELGSSAAPSPKKSFVCAACDKSFHFYCRLKVHVKRCRAAQGKQVPCRECGETKASKKELEKHLQEAHGGAGAPGTPKKKKRRLPVTCDICGREFAHASGMQYHKLTEHFDEKPFSCEECGAKFAANSTLKNHLRLHTGDRPFMCKHCLMTFTQASALAYHTKKKHAEGKMYACQYCNAVFAQSIELSRHVRTHTGDKPYVCRECGKGFRQANGLSIHLRTFHNIDDPYDCKKCRMSFPTLQDHRNHIHEVHSKEYHPCPTCGKIFSAPSLLERHMVTHVRGKPFSCGICDKAYQQLSGLWYHNRTHHPDVFAAQNHRSSKFSALQCSSCDKTFTSTAAHKKHVKAEHADVKFHECETCQELFPTLALLQVHAKCRHSGSQPFRCLYCAASFRFPGALQHHVATEHFRQTENTFPCEVCGELFTSQAQLEAHFDSEHGKVVVTEAQVAAATTQVVQVIQAPEAGASAEQVITLEQTPLAGSQVFVTCPTPRPLKPAQSSWQ
ncbi:zinc finger and BTB domain-containing protein 40 [Phascolarctos cinereus]|uniref:Zinc finger and BTB domain-containing protein 40 n=1 Tax=Phascolarctos cinereus TaxID=38626 RepID=A0A6P5K0G4_PHACI|nr:zinc finger and BTB domain-containing protein 40 [Phascolarctos cinereus]XP_020838688.1 zinc finger and BTB domain-containing protein 40 [Phascolarctos cinereus]XP_020838689.1 zinc finger and BTB domain-containing protein 40 [Phascolarctos cinereus]